MRLQSLMLLTGKMNKTAHRLQKSPGDGNPKPQSACKAAAPGIRLIKIIKHLINLGVRHADTRIVNINGQINAVALLAAFNADMDAALFRKLDGIFQKNLQYMGNFLRISKQHRRYSGVHIKHQLQVVPVPLHGCHCNHVIEHGSEHILLLYGCQRSLHNLRIIQHIVDLTGKTLAGKLYGMHILPKLIRNILLQYHIADSKHHINRRAQLMGHI